MGNFSGSGVRNLLSVWDSLFRVPNSLRYVHTEPREGTRVLNIVPHNFYSNQCRVLEEQLSFAEEISNQATSRDDSVSLSSANLLWSQPALTELRRVLKIGKTLIEGCHGEPCLKAYLRQGERTQAFAETLKEIVWCMSVVFYYNSKGCLSGNPNFMAKDEFPFSKLGAYKELYILQKAALADQTELLASLDIWIQDHLCSAKECGAPLHETEDPPLCIATQILRKRTAAVGIAGVEESSEVDHTSVLWNINSKVLENGVFIGAGSFCSVLETTWLGDTYAKKNFHMHSPDVFRNEANALSKLSHRHMVTVSAYSVDSHTCSLLMERMPFDLRQYMTYRRTLGINPPFTISAAIDLMLQVAEAMRYMHSQKMVHRDLKPANILVEAVDDPELRMEGFVVAKVADFGLATSKREVTAYSHMTRNQGTRRWMAPEMFAADAENDEHLSVAYPFKTDVYSFGIVCFEILTGMIPFPNVRLPELYSLITDADNPLRPELPESCPESLASLIRECWHTHPERRPPFTKICTMLRYLKALLMLTGDGQLQHWMEVPFRMAQMGQHKQLSDSSPPASLFYTTFDGSSWTVAVPLPQDMPSPNEMSITDHEGTMVAIHRSCTGNLFWRTYTGSSWTLPEIIDSASRVANSRPAVASFQGRLFCLYRSEDNGIWCTYTARPNFPKHGWTPALNVGGNARTRDGPALAVFHGRLISVIRGLHNRMIYWNWSSSSGTAWGAYGALDSTNNHLQIASPAQLVVCNNELYCFARGKESNIVGLVWSKLSLGSTTWSPRFTRIQHVGLRYCPSFTAFNNQLVCTVQGEGDQLWYGTVHIFGSLMSIVTTTVPTHYCQGEQALTPIHSKLFCVYIRAL